MPNHLPQLLLVHLHNLIQSKEITTEERYIIKSLIDEIKYISISSKTNFSLVHYLKKLTSELCEILIDLEPVFLSLHARWHKDAGDILNIMISHFSRIKKPRNQYKTCSILEKNTLTMFLQGLLAF